MDTVAATLALPERIAWSLDVGEQLAGALAHCHRLSIVHRDVKPENVLVAPDGDDTFFNLARGRQSLRLVLADFGQRRGSPLAVSRCGLRLRGVICVFVSHSRDNS